MGKSVEASFNLTIVACVSASNYVVPPMFILFGKRLNREIMDNCRGKGRNITVAPRGFTNSNIFLQHRGHFNGRITSSTKRPVIFTFDGSASHYNDDIIKKDIEMEIILILLPANATNLVQTLDIAALKTLKATPKK